MQGARCLVFFFCSQSVKDRVSGVPESEHNNASEASAPVAFRKRVQRYGDFLNWQNFSGLFLRKMKKKGEKGQNGGGFEEELEKKEAERGKMRREEGRDENATYGTP